MTIISWALSHRIAVLAGVAILVFLAWLNLPALSVDLWPDVGNVQVQVLTSVPNLATEESEWSITRPLELQFGGLPNLEETRSLTTFGISQITLIFRDGTDLLRARQLVQERIQEARLPKGYVPLLAPLSDGLGEIFSYALRYRADAKKDLSIESRLTELKTLQDFVVRPALRTVPGIAEVNTTGGYDKQLLVEPDPRKLFQMGLDLADLAVAVESNVGVGAGAATNTADDQTIVRSRARVQTIPDLEHTPIKLSWGSIAVTVKDVASVRYGTKIRTGAATLNGEEAVIGTAMMLVGQNSWRTASSFREKINEIQGYLPKEVEIEPLYDRGSVIDRVITTVRENLAIASVLVLTVLLCFLRNWRAALIAGLVIPIAFLFGLSALSALGYSGNVMSLGALDFGLLVDGAVVVVDNVLVRMRSAQDARRRTLRSEERLAVVREATSEVVAPIVSGWAIILLAYLPVFALTGVAGKLFQPLAVTVFAALLAALPLSLILVPCLCTLLIRRAPDRSKLGDWLTLRYLGILSFAFRHRLFSLGAALVCCFATAVLASRLGVDFFPPLDEGSSVIEVVKPAQINLEESVKWEIRTEKAILTNFPEVNQLFSRIGFSNITTDPQSPNQNDIYISYQPNTQWRRVNGRIISKHELEEAILQMVRQNIPDQELGLSQPIRVRFDEMLEGVRSDVAIKIFGSEQEEIEKLALRIKEIVEKIPGAEDVLLEPIGFLPNLDFAVDRDVMARYLVRTSEVDQALEVGVAGRDVGRVDLNEQFFPITVRLDESSRGNQSTLINLPVRSAEGNLMLTLGQLGRFTEVQRLNTVFHENGERRRAVMINVSGRDLKSFVEEAKTRITPSLASPKNVRLQFGGNYVRLVSGLNELFWIASVLAIVTFLLVAAVLRSWPRALVVYTAVPFALVGGVWALGARGLPFTLSALIGLVAVGGIAILNKLVFVHHFGKLRDAGMSCTDAVIETTRNRLRPVLSTALVASIGFLPMAFSTEMGAEVQRPIAVVIIGGLLTSTLVTLILLPLLLLPFWQSHLKDSQAGVGLDKVNHFPDRQRTEV